jgi:hypothetical protein
MMRKSRLDRSAVPALLRQGFEGLSRDLVVAEFDIQRPGFHPTSSIHHRSYASSGLPSQVCCQIHT